MSTVTSFRTVHTRNLPLFRGEEYGRSTSVT